MLSWELSTAAEYGWRTCTLACACASGGELGDKLWENRCTWKIMCIFDTQACHSHLSVWMVCFFFLTAQIAMQNNQSIYTEKDMSGWWDGWFLSVITMWPQICADHELKVSLMKYSAILKIGIQYIIFAQLEIITFLINKPWSSYCIIKHS